MENTFLLAKDFFDYFKGDGMKFIKHFLKAFLYPIPFIGLRFLPKYLFQLYRYRLFDRSSEIEIYPCLTDNLESTPFDAHYFYQAAWLSRLLVLHQPTSHVDVGSDVKVIGVISAFFPTEFLDLRPLKCSLTGLSSTKGNLTHLPYDDLSVRSISCLHVLEHVGLGRYGDKLDPYGTINALHEITRVIARGGFLYLSVPIGRERICFNAHRVFEPHSFLANLVDFDLVNFSFVDDQGVYFDNASVASVPRLDYGCGLYALRRK